MSGHKFTRRELAALWIVALIGIALTVGLWILLAPESWLTRFFTPLICAVALLAWGALLAKLIEMTESNHSKEKP